MRRTTELCVVLMLLSTSALQAQQMSEADRIRPYAENPFYWQYRSEPVLLLGGSVEDNLFQIDSLEVHLDLLQSVGGNYVRCTMSSRDEGNEWAFERDAATGLYDLTKPNAAYWDRLDRFLEATSERDIIVQFEVWATFDFYDGREMNRPFWQQNPFNPKNNVNYTTEVSGLPDTVASHPTQTENPFFFTVPALDSNGVVLSYQQAFVDKLLEHALPYGNVLYGMDNETSVSPEWGAYWARYIQEKAAERGLTVQTTEMWDAWDLADPMHANTFDHPELYTFVDVSQNNHQEGQAHWDNAQKQRQRIADSGEVRPLNNVKIYGADGGRFGSSRDGAERFWRNVFGGMASARFHRPPSGLGLSEGAQAHLQSAHLLTDVFNVFAAVPDYSLLAGREANEAYAMAEPGAAYAVFFPDGGEVNLDVSAVDSGLPMDVRWLEVRVSRWQASVKGAPEGRRLKLAPPGEGFWVALVRIRGQK
ncbi:MAG: hypothetical protein ACR2GR_01340 [Rhodothermales bacterium]